LENHYDPEPLRFSFVICVTQTYVFTLTGFRSTPPRFAANCGHIRAAGSQGLDHREPQPLAAAGDDQAFSVQILHVSSSSSGHQAWWL
jgi:hypothetical protein